MKRQCHCGDDADETVFGACRRCTPRPNGAPPAQRTLPKLVPSWRFVVPAQYDGDPSDWTDLRPYETTLSDGDGDLG